MENTSTLLKLPELRSYQSDLNDRIFARWRNHDRVMAVLPTGGGKSLLFGAVAANFANRDLRVLALAHREELVVQGAQHLQNWVNTPVGIIKSGHKFQPELTVQFASVQTVVNRLDRVGEFDLIIVDEAHHCTSDTYLSIFERFTTAKILGLTATPIRTDGSPFDHLFDCLEIGVTTAQLIAGGYLSPYKLFVDPNRMKTKGARTSMGDFSTSDLARMNDSIELAGNLVGSYQKYANGGTCMIFAINCEHSESIAAAYNQHGIPAIHLDAKTDKKIRARSLEALRTGEIKVISNVGLFGEGVDIPTLDCVQIARPTKSTSLHLQMCLDMETEVLTHHGFRKCSALRKWHKVGAYDRNTDEIKWTYPLEYIHRQLADGEKMVSISSPTLDIRVTNNHNMVWRSRGSKKSWQLSPAQELVDRSGSYEIPIAGFLKTKGIPLTDDELRFLGWFLSDGSISKKSGQVSIYQSGKQPWLSRIPECLKGCRFKFGVDIRICKTNFGEYERHQFYISKSNPQKTSKHLRGWKDLSIYLNKNLCRAYDQISREQLAVLLEELHYGDGTKMEGQSWTRRSYHISTGNIIFAANIQRLCVTRGFKCNIAKREQNTKKPLYLLHIKDTDIRYIGGNDREDRQILKECEYSPDEWVWCLRNSYGTLVTRRNGKVAIVGNCGRVLRKSPGKEFGTIIDHAGNCELLGLPDDEREWSLQGRPKRERDFDGVDIIVDELERSERVIEVSDVELEEYVVSPTLQIWHQSLPRLLPATRDLFGLHSSPVEFKADSNQFIIEMFSPGLLKIGLNKSAEINRALSDIIGASVEVELILANR